MELESRIKTYQGDDPLNEWLAFIDWIEKNCHDEENDSDLLITTIKQCCHKFYADGKETKKYFNDERFTNLWVKMTTFTSPIETYQFMHKHGVRLKQRVYC